MALRLRGATSGYIELKAPASAGDNTLTLPTNNGSANQLLKTDGSGNLSWVDDNSGVSLSGSTNNTIATVTGANALQGESTLLWSGNALSTYRDNATTFGPGILAHHQRGTIASPSISQTDDTILNIVAKAFDGTDYHDAARIDFVVGAGTPGNNDMPGSIVFKTTDDGTGSSVTRLTIAQSGVIKLDDSATLLIPDAIQHTGDTNTQIRFPGADQLQFDTGGNERLKITNDEIEIKNDASRMLNLITTSGTGSCYLGFSDSGGQKGYVGYGSGGNEVFYIVQNENAQIQFYSNGHTRAFLNADGKFNLDRYGDSAGKGRLEFGNSGEQYIEGYDTGNAGSSSYLSFGDGSSEHARFDSGGRFLLGTTSSINGGLLCVGTGQGSNPVGGEGVKLAPSANTITFLDSSSNSSDIGDIQLWNTVYNNCSGKIQFYHPASNTGAIKLYTHDGTSLKQRILIRNDGYVLIQATSSDMNSADNLGYTFTRHTTSPYLRVKHGGSGSSYANHTLIHFVGATSVIGEVKQDGDGTITYATSSDYRLKENIVDLTGAITRLKNLKPKRFNFKINSGLTKDGFLAHELQEVVPEAVNGTKDEVVTADSKVNNPVLADLNVGDPVYQTADASRVVPLLTAALKEAIAKIETLETKVAALESA